MDTQILTVCLSLFALFPGDDELETIRSLVRDGRYASAQEKAQPLLAAAGKEASCEQAEVLQLVASARRRCGDRTDETLDLNLRALEMRRSLLGEVHPLTLDSLHELGVLYIMRGQQTEAREAFEECARAHEVAGDRAGLARASTFLAFLDPLSPHLERARGIYQELGEKAVPLRLARHHAVAARAADTREAVREEQVRALSIWLSELRADHPLVAAAQHNLAHTLSDLGEWGQARRLLERAIRSFAEAECPSTRHVVSSMTLLGNVLVRMGEHTEAIEVYQGARELCSPQDQRRVELDIIEADAHWRLGDAEQAGRLFERAADAGAPGPYLARTQRGLARLAHSRGELEVALDWFERASSSFLDCQEFDQWAWVTHELAGVLVELGESKAALDRLGKVLAWVEESFEPESELRAWTLYSIAIAHMNSGGIEPAVASALQAQQITLARWHQTFWNLSERVALYQREIPWDGLDLLLHLSAYDELKGGHTREILDLLVRSRSLVLEASALKRQVARNSEDPDVAQRLNELREAAQAYSDLAVRGWALGVDQADDALLASRSKKERADEALSLLLGDRRAACIDSSQVEAALEEGQALVSFATYLTPAGEGRSYLAFVTRKDREPTLISLGPAEEIEERVVSWRDCLRNVVPERRYRALAGSLREAIWDPLHDELKGIESVFVVPDGALHLIPFESLPSGTSEYLIESGPSIQYLTSERELIREGKWELPSRLLIVGGVDFDAEDEPSRSSFDFVSLPASQPEAETIAETWDAQPSKSSVMQLGRDATESAFKQQAPECNVLHLATHGFFRGSEAWEGTRGESPFLAEKNDLRTLSDYVVHGSVLSSGLAFAGANHLSSGPNQDGILTGEEIAHLDLDKVELVVLSACDTGLGDVSVDEGVFGLRRAFRLAGVERLVLSLWSVEDESAGSWMSAFYRELEEPGCHPSEAARRASLDLLNKGRSRGSAHPHHWAPFIAIGR